MSKRQEYRVIPLTKGFVTIIDAKNFRRVNRHSWRVHFSAGTRKKHGEPYARATINKKDVYLHRFLYGLKDVKLHVDHKNRQTLDNREENHEIVPFHVNIKRQRPRKCHK